MQGVQILDSKKKGPTTVIVGMVHGNEIVGKYVLDFFLKKTKKTSFCGKIILLEANVAAARKNIRFIHADLNRSFSQESDSTLLETKRAAEIKDFFKKIKIDFVFDLHSTPSESDAMILCTSQTRSNDLAKKFPIKKIIKNLIDIVEGMSLVKYFTTRGAVGLAFETGCHKNKKAIGIGIEIAEIIRDIHNQNKVSDQKKQEIITVDEIVYVTDPKFIFTRPYKGFEIVKPGEIRGKDSQKMYRSASEKILLMPNTKFQDDLKKISKTRLVYFGKKE